MFNILQKWFGKRQVCIKLVSHHKFKKRFLQYLLTEAFEKL